MSAETAEQTIVVKTEGAAAGSAAVIEERKCPLGDRHIHRDDVKQVWKECHEESLWYRALPLSVGSMAVTGGLLYNGIWKTSPRFGPFPKLIVAGVLGYAVGKASYIPTCRSKMQKLSPPFGPEPGKGFGPAFGPGHRGLLVGLKKKSGYWATANSPPTGREISKVRGAKPIAKPLCAHCCAIKQKHIPNRHCHHVCEECKKQAETAPAEKA